MPSGELDFSKKIKMLIVFLEVSCISWSDLAGPAGLVPQGGMSWLCLHTELPNVCVKPRALQGAIRAGDVMPPCSRSIDGKRKGFS